MATAGDMELEPMADVFLQDDLAPTIAEHASECAALFKRYMDTPDILPDPTVMDDQLARFTLWAKNMEVYGPPNVSLDYRLRYSPTVVEIIHQLLNVIGDTLASLKSIEDPPQTPSRKKQRISGRDDTDNAVRFDDDSDMESYGDSIEENLSKITYTVGGTVTRLFRLSNAIRKSATAKRAHKIGKYKDDKEANTAIDELRLYTKCYIEYRFPEAPESLRSALIEANALRLRRLYYQRSHRRRIGLSVLNPNVKASPVQLPKMKESAPAIKFAPDVFPKPVSTVSKNGPPPAPVTTATTARQTAVGAFYAKPATDVPRAKSVVVNNKLSFPPIPSTNECPYCGVIIEFRSTIKSTQWHDHVIRDLEPFICIFKPCIDSDRRESDLLTFETSKAWMNHLQNAHGSVWECRAPSHALVTFEEEAQYQEHSCKEHGVPQAHVATLSKAARRPVINKVLECPFGDDFQPPEKIESSPVFSSESLHLHVAAHMKQIALLALQKLPDDGHEDDENVGSDQPLDDDAQGFAKLRGSMYSILDDDDLDFEDAHDDGETGLRESTASPAVEKLDLEDRDEHGMASLHRAAGDGDVDSVRSILAKGGNVHIKAHDGRTPIHFAAKSGSCEIIRILAENHADVNSIDNHDLTPLSWAVVACEHEAVIALLDLGVDVNFATDNGSAIGWAVSSNYMDMVELLVDKGANVNAPSGNKQITPLEEAAITPNVAICKSLISKGADINYRDRDGWSAVHWAAERHRSDTVACLIDNGADVNAISSYGTAPLHCAANGGSYDTVQMLLSSGADPVKSTCHGWTPLHHAAFMKQHKTVELLVQDARMSSVASQQDNHGWTALHLAVWSRDLVTVRTLLTCPAVVEGRTLYDESGLTAEEWLDLAPSSHSYKAISNLAFSKSRCCRAVTGLRRAVITGDVAMINFFLSIGPQYQPIDDADTGNRTALYCAAKKGDLALVDTLLKKGSNPNILPTGRWSWEEFISDGKIISRLAQAGYQRPQFDPAIKEQMKLVLKGRGVGISLHDPPTSSHESPALGETSAPGDKQPDMDWQSTGHHQQDDQANRTQHNHIQQDDVRTEMNGSVRSVLSRPEVAPNQTAMADPPSRATKLWKRLRRR